MIIYTYQFLFYLVFTIIVETAVLFFFTRKFLKIDSEKTKNAKIIFSGIFASFSTIPYVWYVFPILIYWSENLAITLGEIFAIFVESIIFYFILGINYKKVLFVSFVANIISFLLGFMIGNMLDSFKFF